jgi:UDP-N-acetylmuramate dehydrogenase
MLTPLQENISLAPFHTFHLQATARYYSFIQDAKVLLDLLDSPALKSLPRIVLGNGSNILFVQDFEGWVIHMGLGGIEKIQEDHQHVYLQVGAGVQWHDLVVFCVERDYAGVENLSFIPGTVGAAPVQNIGAYGVELSEVFVALEALEMHTGIIRRFTKKDCKFGYRESVFKHEWQGEFVILSVTLRLDKHPTFRTSYGAIEETLAAMQVKQLSIKAISDAIIHIRKQRIPDPAIVGNAGSFFKNPVIDPATATKLQQDYPNLPVHLLPDDRIKIPAAWLIEQCGWKGYKRGEVGVHQQHALILVNYGGARGEEVWQLAQDIQQSVYRKFAIQLVPEVEMI